ncbi:MAG: ABC transporter permease [Myxococcales bacterium]|nr:ABC transporter permease [Myxococcales bacterium]
MWLDLPKLALRNVGRNRRRSLITGTALVIGISLCVAAYGLVDGLGAQLLRSLTKLDIGQVQIHEPGFIRERRIQERIEDVDQIVTAARHVSGVHGAAARLYAAALVSGERASAGVELVGVDPTHEPEVTELDRARISGHYLPEAPTPWPARRALSAEELAADAALTERSTEEAMEEIDALTPLDGDAPAAEPRAQPEPPPALSDAAADDEASREMARALSPRPERPLPAFVGVGLASVLDVKVGDRIYASTLAVDGGAEGSFLEVVGIFETGTALHDRHRLYLHLADLQRLTHLEGAAHEVALAVEPSDLAGQVADTLRGEFPALSVRPWYEVRPDIQQMLRINEVSTDLMVFIIFVVATLGVVNTMLMSVFERTRELGVLKAIGMPAGKILALILFEALVLVLAASFVGTLAGLGLDVYMVHHGVDLRGLTKGFSLGGLGIDPVIHGAVTLRGVLLPSFVLSVCCVVASIYPALRAARMQPAIGMRET